MDGESGLDDTSPAGDREFRASAVEKWKVGMQTNTHPPSPKHTHTHTHTRASSLHPLPGSLEESTRTWLAHDECEPWLRGEVKVYLPLSRTVLSPSQQYTHLLSLQSYRDYRVKSTVWDAAVQMCGQPTEIPNSFAPPSTSLLQTNMPIPGMFLPSLTLFTGIVATCLSWDCYIVCVYIAKLILHCGYKCATVFFSPYCISFTHLQPSL